jgi:UDP-N-acetyl-2-amino-2-deoxyglucuronate dehydrogenase
MINFAIIGCGRIAQRHAEHINRFGRLVAVCDIVPEKATSLAATYGANAYASIEDLLASEMELDVVSVTSPNGLHFEHTISSLRAGKHVLCEKPMAIDVHHCGEMIKEAERMNRRLFIVKQNRFNPPVQAVKEILDARRLGRILSVQLNCFWNRNDAYYKDSWKGTAALDGGTLFTQFSHFVDLLYWFFGDVKTIKSITSNALHKDVIEFEDQGVVALEFFNGALGTIHYTVNSFSKNMEGSLTVFGEKGSIKIGGQYLNELEYQCIDGFEITDLPQGNPPNMYGNYVGSMSNHDKVYQNVVDVLAGKGSISTNGFEGLKTVEIIERIYKSVKNGRSDLS